MLVHHNSHQSTCVYIIMYQMTLRHMAVTHSTFVDDDSQSSNLFRIHQTNHEGTQCHRPTYLGLWGEDLDIP